MTFPLLLKIGQTPDQITIDDIQKGISYDQPLSGDKYLNEARQIDQLLETNPELTIIIGKNPSGREYKAVVETEGHIKKIVIYSRIGDGQWEVAKGPDGEPLNIQQVLPDVGYEQNGKLYNGLGILRQRTYPSYDPPSERVTLEGKQTIYLKTVEEKGLDFAQADIKGPAGAKKPAAAKSAPPIVSPPNKPKVTQVKVNEKGDDDIISQELLIAMGVKDSEDDDNNIVDVYDLDTNKDGLISWEEVEAANIGISIGLYNVIFDNMNAEAFSAKEPMGECDYGKFREFGKVAKKFGNITNRKLDEAVTLYKKCRLANVNLDELETAKGNIADAIKAQLKGAKLTPQNLATVLKNCGYKQFIIIAMLKEFANIKEITPEMVAAQILDSIMGSGFSRKVQKKYWKIVHPLSKPFPFKTCNLNAENIENFITGQKMTEKSAEEAEGSESAETASPSRLSGMTNRQLWAEKQKLDKKQEAEAKEFEKLIEAGKGIFVMDGKLPKIEGGEVVLTPVAQGDPEAKNAADKYIRMLKRLQNRQREIGFINFKLNGDDAEPMYKLAYGKYQEVLDDPKASPLEKAHAYILKANIKNLTQEELRENPDKYPGINGPDKAAKEQAGAALFMAIKPKIAENCKAAKKILEEKYFENGQLKDDVPKEEKAIALYLYARALAGSADSSDRESLSATNIKYTQLMKEASKYINDISEHYPFKENIKKEIDKIKEETKGQLAAELEFQRALAVGVPSELLGALDNYIKSLEDEITRLENKSSLDPEEKKNLRKHYEKLFSLYNAKGNYEKCLEITKKIVEHMESGKIEKDTKRETKSEDKQPVIVSRGINEWKEIKDELSKNAKKPEYFLVQEKAGAKFSGLLDAIWHANKGNKAKTDAAITAIGFIALLQKEKNNPAVWRKLNTVASKNKAKITGLGWPDPTGKMGKYDTAKEYIDSLFTAVLGRK